MSEVEYDLLLEAVQTAIAPAPEDDFVVQTQRSYPAPRAASSPPPYRVEGPDRRGIAVGGLGRDVAGAQL